MSDESTAVGTIKIRGSAYDVPNPSDLDLGECMLIKQIADYGVIEFYGAIMRSEGPALAAFALVVLQRAGQKVTLDDVQQIKLSEFELDFAEEADSERPTSAASSGDAETGSPPSSSDSPGSEATPAEDGNPPSEPTG